MILLNPFNARIKFKKKTIIFYFVVFSCSIFSLDALFKLKKGCSLNIFAILSFFFINGKTISVY